MEGKRLMKRVDAVRVAGRRRRRRLQPRWEDCVKRDLAGLGGRTRVRDGEWRTRDGEVENESEGWGSR